MKTGGSGNNKEYGRTYSAALMKNYEKKKGFINVNTNMVYPGGKILYLSFMKKERHKEKIHIKLEPRILKIGSWPCFILKKMVFNNFYFHLQNSLSS